MVAQEKPTKTMKNECILTIYLQPGAKKSAVFGLHDGNIKIKVNAPAADGKANAALIDFLSDFLEIPKSAIQIISGHKSRIKKLKMVGVTGDIIQSKFHFQQ